MKLYEKLDNSTSHKKIIELLAEHFQRLEPAEVKITAYLALGTIGPRFEKIDLGIGDKYGIQAISQAYDVDIEKVEIAFENQGDLGDVASDLNDRQRSSLTLKYVFQHFVQIRDVSGRGSQKRKINLLAEVLSQARPLESRYILRIAQGNLRLGFGEKFLLEALALAFTGSRDNTAKVEDTYNICTDIGQLGESLANHGMGSLGKFSIKIGRPVQMMLASRVDTMEELNEKFSGTMAAEEKYDGERVQVHVDGDYIKAFSRRLTDISAQFPDVIEAVRESVKAEKVVLDGEIVAYRQRELLPFQELMQRRRKYRVKEYVEKIPVSVFFFDVIYLDGKSLMNRSYPERRQVLEQNLVETEKVKLAGRVVSADFSRIQRFFDACVEKGMEGIIIKSVKAKSTYRPGKRGWLWVKWKKEYIEDVRETFDLVIVGSYHGKGRRKGSFGALLCAVLNESEKRYETLAKVGTGFKDEDFAEINDLLKKYAVEKQPVNILVDSDMQPDKYIEPAVVIEVIGSEITSSPSHTSGQENSGNGYALRFPRFLRIRYDKGPEDATTVEEVKHLK